MPSLIDLRRRIRAVKSTQQITKAMKMIAASRLKRAQDRVVAARPFAQRMLKVLNGLVSRVDQDAHPLLRMPAPDRPAAADRHHRRSRPVRQLQLERHQGRRAVHRQRRARPRDRARADRPQGTRLLPPPRVRRALRGGRHLPEADVRRRGRHRGCGDRGVHLRRRVERLSRLQRVQVGDDAADRRRAAAADSAARSGRRGAGPTVDYLYEPAPEEIFKDLLPRHVQVQVYRALLESNAAFFAAQMTAMDAATRNSADMIENLTLYMNKVRQAAITREIIEVVSGAAAT